jgi:hypothetical protein
VGAEPRRDGVIDAFGVFEQREVPPVDADQVDRRARGDALEVGEGEPDVSSACDEPERHPRRTEPVRSADETDGSAKFGGEEGIGRDTPIAPFDSPTTYSRLRSMREGRVSIVCCTTA